MRIADDYSSWCRALLTPADRAAIHAAGEGAVWFSRPNRKWCARVDADGRTSVGFDPKRPGVAFANALAAMEQEKDGKAMPPYRRVMASKIVTPEWTVPAGPLPSAPPSREPDEFDQLDF